MYLRFEPFDLLFGYLIFWKRYASGHSMFYGVAYTCIYIHILQSDSASLHSMGGAHGVHIGLHKIWLLVTLSILMYTMAS